MGNKVYVGNLSYKCAKEDLEELFGQYGEVADARVVSDRETGRSRGFGFVTFAEDSSVQGALEQNGQNFQGRDLKVNEAKEQQRREGGSRY